jgi:hypothetical protein
MTHVAQVLMTLIALFIWGIALLVFLLGAAFLANRDMPTVESIACVLLFSAISIAMAYGGWRLIVWARSWSHS